MAQHSAGHASSQNLHAYKTDSHPLRKTTSPHANSESSSSSSSHHKSKSLLQFESNANQAQIGQGESAASPAPLNIDDDEVAAMRRALEEGKTIHIRKTNQLRLLLATSKDGDKEKNNVTSEMEQAAQVLASLGRT
jgi:hypothetical protein